MRNSIRLALLLCCCGVFANQAHAEIRLNEVAFNHAKQLIEEGHFTPDKKGNWRADQPTNDEKTAFIRSNGIGEYAMWHLAIDDRIRTDAKPHYKFICGDFKTVHRCALLAVKSRAHQYGYSNIERAADQLLELFHTRQSIMPSMR